MTTIHIATPIGINLESNQVVDQFLKNPKNNISNHVRYVEVHEARKKILSIRIKIKEYTDAGKDQLALNLLQDDIGKLMPIAFGINKKNNFSTF